jgi:SAM-dependent methyltransferase
MISDIPPEDSQRIQAGIREKYSKVAVSPEGQFRYPTGRAGLEALGYAPELIQALPAAVAASYCGVGNPFSLGPLRAGDAVLDLGCGAGVDAIMAARLVGPSGPVAALDLVPEMLARAQENARLAGVVNIQFREGSAEALPFPDNSFGVVISNGVFNLVVDKIQALREVFRVLKPGGRFMVADQVLAGELPQETQARIDKWAS